MKALDLSENKELYSKEEINELPILSYEGEIVLVRNQKELQTVLPLIKRAKILGFDTETRPIFKKGITHLPSLLQLASDELVCLFQLNLLPFDVQLANVLEDLNIIKVGVAIRDDLNALTKLHLFKPQNFIDLAKLATQKGVKAQGLRTLTANLLGYRISKRAQCSNWASNNLSHAQIKYAATDAWLGFILYNKLMEMADK